MNSVNKESLLLLVKISTGFIIFELILLFVYLKSIDMFGRDSLIASIFALTFIVLTVFMGSKLGSLFYKFVTRKN